MRRLSVLAALLVGAGATAQTPDSAAVARDTLAAALPRPTIALPEAPRGRRLAPVPAVTPALSVESLFLGAPPALAAPSPAAFVYTLAAPGRAGGVAWDGLDPARATLSLDGRPFTDLLTGAPRYDLLPAEALGETVGADTRRGAPFGAEATVRTFRLARPITELRYHTGREGIQAASGTHAQTRRAPAFLAGGSPDARLTASLHVATRTSSGPVAAGQMQHTHALGRVLLTRPRLALDAGALYVDRTDGARRGVVAPSFADLFTSVAQPRDAAATRQTRRTEAWATARVRVLSSPTTVAASVARQRLTYSPLPTDTLETWATATTLALTQPLGRGPSLRLTGTWEGDPTGGTDPLGDPGPRLVLHAEAADTLGVGALRLAVAAGGHAVGGRAFPSASVRATAGRLMAGVRLAGAVPGRIEATGLAGRILAAADARETTLLAEASAWTRPRTLAVGVRAVVHRRWHATLLAARGDSLFAFETATAPLDRAAVTLGTRWRDARPRGVYVRAETTVGGSLAPDASPLHRREADSLPRVHATVRVGTRATQVGGVVDLDLAATARAWSAFRSRLLEPATGLLALPEPGATLGYEVPARGTLDLGATATFSGRATVFLGVENVLGRAVHALVVPGEPLPGAVLRFGVFWALLD